MNFRSTVRGLLLPFLTLAMALLLISCSENETAQIRVERGMIPELPPVIKVAAGYMVVHNDSPTPVYLVEASSDAATSVEIHRSIVVDDIAKMEHQHEVEIPPGGTLDFSNASGYHLMFYEISEMRKGDRIPVSLEFKNGTRLATMFDVVDRSELQ